MEGKHILLVNDIVSHTTHTVKICSSKDEALLALINRCGAFLSEGKDKVEVKMIDAQNFHIYDVIPGWRGTSYRKRYVCKVMEITSTDALRSAETDPTNISVKETASKTIIKLSGPVGFAAEHHEELMRVLEKISLEAARPSDLFPKKRKSPQEE